MGCLYHYTETYNFACKNVLPLHEKLGIVISGKQNSMDSYVLNFL